MIQIFIILQVCHSPGMSDLIRELGNEKTLLEALLNLAESGNVLQAMNLLRKENPNMYLKQWLKIEKPLVKIGKEKHLESQKEYDISDFYLSDEIYKSLIDYSKKGKKPVLATAIVGEAGTGKTNFFISLFEHVFNCQVFMVKTADGLHHANFFKRKQYAIIFDDLDWRNVNRR